MRLRFLLALVVGICLSSSAGALSTRVGGASCSSCQGANISLEIVDNGGSFSVTLTINADGYTGKKSGLVRVGFGGIRGWSSVALNSSPASSAAAWSNPVGANARSAGLCRSGRGRGGVCSTGFVDISGGGDFVWEFTVDGGRLQRDVADWRIRGQYANRRDLQRSRGPRGNRISESGLRPVPEPGAALLFAVGALVSLRSLPRKR